MASIVETTIRTVVTKGVETVAGINRKRQRRDRQHAFLSGLHTPVSEERTITDLTVTGTIPADLSGRYVRIGPNPFKPDPRGHHWFVGDGMVHGVYLKGGKAEWYRNRYIRSRKLEAQGGPSAAPGPRLSADFDTVNTNVIGHGGKTWALVEAGSFPVELSHDLESVAYTDLEGTLRVPFTAHPHEDPQTGELHAITYNGTTHDKVWYVRVSPEGSVTREVTIPVEHGPSIHESSLTARYVLIFDLPVTFSMSAVIGGATFPYRWNPDHKARVGLLPREGGADEIIWCEVDPLYVFHVSNSFDAEDGTVVVDLCAYETMFEPAGSGGVDGPVGKPLGLERWVIDPAARAVSRKTIDATPQEFPRPDERFFGQPYRYAWSMGLATDDPANFIGHAPIFAFDLHTGERTVRDFGPAKVPGEFVFVPQSADAPEGHGWLMGYVIDGASGTTDLVILDAQDIAGEPVATVHIPCRIPPGFHGNWIAD
ncbi:carotenoid oxygenase family protein [Novosphingobium sp.]|uniref:8'-apo-carotenoid 13,14-cleaving dioxygenase n=1 Tax=Novosphingobium sp. TaxID=1874826 RepID=UPI003BAC4D57